jgi:hypothetical protein
MEDKALIIVAAEEEGAGISRVWLRRIPALTRRTLHEFLVQAVEPGSTVLTDGLNASGELAAYRHDPVFSGHNPRASASCHESTVWSPS